MVMQWTRPVSNIAYTSIGSFEAMKQIANLICVHGIGRCLRLFSSIPPDPLLIREAHLVTGPGTHPAQTPADRTCGRPHLKF